MFHTRKLPRVWQERTWEATPHPVNCVYHWASNAEIDHRRSRPVYLHLGYPEMIRQDVLSWNRWVRHTHPSDWRKDIRQVQNSPIVDKDAVCRIAHSLPRVQCMFQWQIHNRSSKKYLSKYQNWGTPNTSTAKPTPRISKERHQNDQIKQLLEWVVIEPSFLPTAWAVILVKQKDKWRFGVDFWQLNGIRKGESYPMLWPDYIFGLLADKYFYSTLDTIKRYL